MTRSDNNLYVAGWNMPGCLPEMDPAVFETEDEATRYLTYEIDRFWDEDFYYVDAESRETIDARWLSIHASLQYETAPYSVQNGDGSLAFWVAIVPRSDIPTFDSEGN